MAWWCAGVRWREGRPELRWFGDGRGERGSVLGFGQELAFVARGERCCVGVWRAGRRTPCPVGAVVPGRGTRDQCAECARIDRSFSVAADTNAADQRPYAVYLAWFGPGLLKVGITGVRRGPARLLEQGAVAFAWLGRGPLMAARRAEELLGAALKVPDRISYARKRAARLDLPPLAARVAELRDCHARAVALAGWPESLRRVEFEPVDHAGLFGLEELRDVAEVRVVRELVDGGGVAGRLVGVAGPDLLLRPRDGGGPVVVDGRLLGGWRLVAAETEAERAGVSVPVEALTVRDEGSRGVQGGLF
ncbi:DUF2797 domain-containing protein [Streptomyces cavernicola]|uniref:DUF2797 domain-containing protein n=1 Tax=Streptomyces cavernicola TaxID=3043613 RepID=A0ABT6S3I5_9ACTN|nr:DUF2797 domain-containing protein [Streptomyces sp. B-S-A6]MDI3402664.1 DUF2797 domain-containing protein [Streptomyces sp. B-S-A6]